MGFWAGRSIMTKNDSEDGNFSTFVKKRKDSTFAGWCYDEILRFAQNDK